MSFSYTFKRLIRSWRLFIALLLGIVLASTFFAGINVGADTAARQALDQKLSQALVDVVVSASYSYGYMDGRQQLLSSEDITGAMQAVLGVADVTSAEVISEISNLGQVIGKNLSMPFFRLVGISNHSKVYDGWMGGVPAIKPNETYVWSESKDAEVLDVGDVIQLNFTISRVVNDVYVQDWFLYNLTVAGSAQLSDQALAIATMPFGGVSENLLIVSWEKTMAGLLDFVNNLSPSYNPFYIEIFIYLDRAALISPWDISGSINKLNAVTFQINNVIAKYNLFASNQLVYILSNYQNESLGMRVLFIIVALPVFFVAWYMGSTVSDVSFNLRRREIGLLLTKGFSRRQLFWMFLLEAILIGLLGGVFGIVLSFTLSPFFVSAAGGQFTGVPVIGLDSMVLTVAFAVAITFLSAYWPARRASKMAPVDALREYVYVEEVKPYRRLWPWAALIIGSYKMIVFILGINIQTEIIKLGAPTNILLFFLLNIFSIIDFVLIFIGPFLFFWGFTKIFIRGSLKFQEVTAKAAKFLGDLGELATKSVQRNPARAAAVAFLIAAIIGYSVQMAGTLASEQDYEIRETYFYVGSDVSVALSTAANASTVMDTIRNNTSSIKSATVEYTFWGSVGLGTYGQQMELRGIDPNVWLSTAYYEDGLISGNSFENAFERMRSNNLTIILERNFAKALNKKVDDVVSVTFGEKTVELTVVGFFGIEPPQLPGQMESFSLYRVYWSYVPEGLYNELKETVGDSSAKILIKLESGADSKAVANQIRQLNINANSVSSVAEQLKERYGNPTVMGAFNILRLGVIFIVVAASIGTALITLVSLRERKREASIMSVRGLSFKQLLVMLLTENLAVVIFAVLLGAAVGLLALRGAVATLNALNTFSYTPLSRRMFFSPDALLTLFISFSLVFVSTIIPIILVANIYSSRLERTVREV